ncbi:ABC transporter substrate-binding protein, partial [bacterium]|nr:ABC transporter substrate-binding protein [bacterium]
EMLIRDDQGDPEVAREIAMELTDNGIRFILGPFITASGTMILAIINQSEILTISGTIMGDNLENLDDYFIKLNPSTRTFGSRIAEFLIGEGFKRLGFIGDSKNDPYCTTFFDGYRSTTLKDLGSILPPVKYDGREEISYSQIAARIIEGDSDSVLVCASALDTALLSQHMKRMSPGIFLMSTPWGISEELLRNGGDAVEGLHFFMSVQYSDLSARAMDFEKRFQSRFRQEISFAAIFNYEAAVMLIEALRTGPEDGPEKIKRRILDKSVHKGVQMDFGMDSEGDPIRPLILHKIEEGQFRSVGIP